MAESLKNKTLKGVAVKEGKFIGPPLLKMAEKILAKLEMIK